MSMTCFSPVEFMLSLGLEAHALLWRHVTDVHVDQVFHAATERHRPEKTRTAFTDESNMSVHDGPLIC
jgi:hypothetical protein